MQGNHRPSFFAFLIQQPSVNGYLLCAYYEAHVSFSIFLMIQKRENWDIFVPSPIHASAMMPEWKWTICHHIVHLSTASGCPNTEAKLQTTPDIHNWAPSSQDCPEPLPEICLFQPKEDGPCLRRGQRQALEKQALDPVWEMKVPHSLHWFSAINESPPVGGTGLMEPLCGAVWQFLVKLKMGVPLMQWPSNILRSRNCPVGSCEYMYKDIHQSTIHNTNIGQTTAYQQKNG